MAAAARTSRAADAKMTCVAKPDSYTVHVIGPLDEVESVLATGADAKLGGGAAGELTTPGLVEPPHPAISAARTVATLT